VSCSTGLGHFKVRSTEGVSTWHPYLKTLSVVSLLLSVFLIPSAVSAAGAGSSIWPSSAVPSTADAGPDSAVELGMKFRSDVNGYITGIRFYKGAGNTGTHIGNLWSANGSKLASATFSSE